MTAFHELRQKKQKLYQEYCRQRKTSEPQQVLQQLNIAELNSLSGRLRAYLDSKEGTKKRTLINRSQEG